MTIVVTEWFNFVMFTRLTKVFMAAFLLWGSGCTSIAESVLEKPTARFHSVQLREAGPDRATAVFAIDVENPNATTLKIDRLLYSLTLGGRAISKTELVDPPPLKARASTRVEIPVPFQYQDVFSSLMELMKAGSTSFQLEGEVQSGILRVPFSEKGELKLR